MPFEELGTDDRDGIAVERTDDARGPLRRGGFKPRST